LGSAAPPPPPLALDIVAGPYSGHMLRGPPGAARLTLGRDAQRNLCIKDPAISQMHAAIVWEADRPGGEGRYTISDLGSSNGTWLNGEEVVRQGPAVDLAEGDVLQLGKATKAMITVRARGGGGRVWVDSCACTLRLLLCPPAPGLSIIAPPTTHTKQYQTK
jgi:hypothetical protein